MGKKLRQMPRPSAFALPSESADDFLTLIDANGADLFRGSQAQPVTLQLEKSHLILPREELVARHVDFGRELVSVDGEFSAVDKQRLEERRRLVVVGCRLAICSHNDEGHESVRRKNRPAFRVRTKWFAGVTTDNLNGP